MVEIGTGSRIPIWWTFFSKPEVVISQPCWPLMSTKFGLLIDFDLLKARTSTNTNWPHWLMRALVDHTLPNKLQRSAIAKLNTSQWFYWLVYLSYQVFILCQKTILSNRFATLTYLLTHSRSTDVLSMVTIFCCVYRLQLNFVQWHLVMFIICM